MKSFTIGKNDAGRRLDAFLSRILNIPQPLLYKYIRLKRVRVNGKPGGVSLRLNENDILEVYLSDDQFRSKDDADTAYLKVKPHLSVVYEDENILIADKPFGLLVHPDKGENVNTLIAHIKAYLYQKGEYLPHDGQTFAPALCNRIDRNTGGLVIAAKNAESLRIINERLRLNEIRRFYLCVAHGVPEKREGVLEHHLFKDEDKNRVFLYDKPQKSTKPARTRYKVMAVRGGMSLLEAELLTGRTHQIRAQLAGAGHPLAGDGKYGKNAENKGVRASHQALYSYKLFMDFSSSAGALDYLRHKIFQAPRVEFAEKFLKNGRI